MKLIKDSIYEFINPKTDEYELGDTVLMGEQSFFTDEMKSFLFKFVYEKQVRAKMNDDNKIVIDISGDFVINDDNYGGISELPEFINFDIIHGNFVIIGNFNSMRGFPNYIKKDFYIADNNLSSLEDLPSKVDGDILIKNNKIKLTEEDIKSKCEVKGEIYA